MSGSAQSRGRSDTSWAAPQERPRPVGCPSSYADRSHADCRWHVQAEELSGAGRRHGGKIEPVAELTDVENAFAYGESVLVGELVRLRSVRDEDLQRLARWEMDPATVATLSNWVICPSEATARERIAKWCANDNNDVGFAIETLGDPPVLVGSIHLAGARPKDRRATLGIALAREHIGHGYGTDATRVLADYAFREMGLHRIQLAVAPFNRAGVRAYEKAGFVEEGRHREAVWHDGRWYDEVLMSLLDHEWAARRTRG